jgi:hypothetical protein
MDDKHLTTPHPPADAWALMDAYGRGPNYYRTALPNPSTIQLLLEDIDRLRSKMHGKERQLMRRQISKAIDARETLLAQGKLQRVINSVLQNDEPYYDMSTLTLPDGNPHHRPHSHPYNPYPHHGRPLLYPPCHH